MSEIFLSVQHPASRRYAILEDDGTSAWLYLTEPDDTTPVADCWIYNRVPAPRREELSGYRNGPPPAAQGFADDRERQSTPPDAAAFRFVWSEDGHSAALLINGLPEGLIADGYSRGYSRRLLRSGPWGEIWDDALYRRLFAGT